DALFKIDLGRTRCLQRPMPFVCRLEIFFANGEKFGFVQFLCHGTSLLFSVGPKFIDRCALCLMFRAVVLTLRAGLHSQPLMPAHHAYRLIQFAGVLIASAKSLRKTAAWAPSITRWSPESVSVIIGRTAGCPFNATTRSEIRPTARIAAWGGTMMAL